MTRSSDGIREIQKDLYGDLSLRRQNYQKEAGLWTSVPGTGSVAAKLARQIGENGLVVGLDFLRSVFEKAKGKAFIKKRRYRCIISIIQGVLFIPKRRTSIGLLETAPFFSDLN
jgi:hypothetical protein